MRSVRGRPPDQGEEGRCLGLRHASMHRGTDAHPYTCTPAQQECCAGAEDAVRAVKHTTHTCVSPLSRLPASRAPRIRSSLGLLLRCRQVYAECPPTTVRVVERGQWPSTHPAPFPQPRSREAVRFHRSVVSLMVEACPLVNTDAGGSCRNTRNSGLAHEVCNPTRSRTCLW